MSAFSARDDQDQTNDQSLQPSDLEVKGSKHPPAPISVSLSLAAAIRAHKKGKMEKAVKIYSDILKKYPEHADANYLLGVAAFERGLKEDAVAMIERAIAADPDNATYHGRLGEIYTLLGQVELADEAYIKAAELAPGDVRFHLGRAQILERNGDIDKARSQYLEIIKKWPDSAETHYRFAAIEARVGDRVVARKHAAKAISLQETYAESHFLYALLCMGQGDARKARGHFALSSKHAPEKTDLHLKSAKKLIQLQDFENALACLYRQTRMNPHDFDAFALMGDCLVSKGEQEGAVVSYDRALEIKKDHLPALCGKALCLVHLSHIEDAIETAHEVVGYHPNHWQSHMIMGMVYRENYQVVDAIDILNKAVKIAPNEADVIHELAKSYLENLEINQAIHYARAAMKLAPKNKEIEMTLAHCLLQGEEWAEGWQHFEVRHHQNESDIIALNSVNAIERWDGSKASDKRLLVYMDGTKSDAIQFARLISLLNQRVKDVYFYCQKDMARLFADLDGLSGVIPFETPLPRVDMAAPIGSLPYLLGLMDSKSLEMGSAYLQPSQRDVDRWKEKIKQDSQGLSVGLVWQSDQTGKIATKNSPGIWPFSRLFYMRNIDFFGLQTGDGNDVFSDPQLAKVVRNYGRELLDDADKAALIESLDVIVTCDTSVAHLAGAMNKSVWMVVPFGMDWRWGIPTGEDIEQTLWYPSMKIFRQSEPGDWADVFARIGLALDQVASNS